MKDKILDWVGATAYGAAVIALFAICLLYVAAPLALCGALVYAIIYTVHKLIP